MFNPEWENLPNFKRFIESKNPTEKYPYTDSSNCACAQYLKSEGKYTSGWLGNNSPDMRSLNSLAAGETNSWTGLNSDGWTFGHLLDRVNAKIKELEPV